MRDPADHHSLFTAPLGNFIFSWTALLSGTCCPMSFPNLVPNKALGVATKLVAYRLHESEIY